MTQTTNSPRGTSTSTDNTGIAQRTVMAAGQRSGSARADVTATLQASTKPTQGQPNQHGQWKEKTGTGSHQNPQQNNFRGRDDKNQHSGSKK